MPLLTIMMPANVSTIPNNAHLNLVLWQCIQQPYYGYCYTEPEQPKVNQVNAFASNSEPDNYCYPTHYLFNMHNVNPSIFLRMLSNEDNISRSKCPLLALVVRVHRVS